MSGPTHSLVTWRYREAVTMVRGKRVALNRARELVEQAGISLEVWRLKRGLRREKLAVVHPASTVARVVLIGCSKQKHKERTQARDMYTSTLFRKQLVLALLMVPPTHVFIVSAHYGLLPLDQLIAPYENSIKTHSREDRAAWAYRVFMKLSDRMSERFGEKAKETDLPLRSLDIVLLMGASYARPVRAAAPEEWTFTEPLAGMQVGERLRWLNRAIRRAKKRA